MLILFEAGGLNLEMAHVLDGEPASTQPSFTQYFHVGGAYSPPCVLSSIF